MSETTTKTDARAFWLRIAAVPGLLAAFGVTWVASRRGDPAAKPAHMVTRREVCGDVEACWAVQSTRAAVASLPAASAGRYWIFNWESPPRGAYADGFDMEVVRAPDAGRNHATGGAVQNHTMGGAHDCIVEHCDSPLRACGSSPLCRGAWRQLLAGLDSVMDVAQLRLEDIERDDVATLASCFFSRCLCIADLGVAEGERAAASDDDAAGDTGPTSRFPDAIDDDDVVCRMRSSPSLDPQINTRRSHLNLIILLLTRPCPAPEQRAILSLADDSSYVEDRRFGAQPRGKTGQAAGPPPPLGGQRCTYLQSRFTTDPRTARLYARLRELVVAADARRGWRRVHAPTLVPRTIELLNYSSAAQVMKPPPAPSLAVPLGDKSLSPLLLTWCPPSHRCSMRTPRCRSDGTSTSSRPSRRCCSSPTRQPSREARCHLAASPLLVDPPPPMNTPAACNGPSPARFHPPRPCASLPPAGELYHLAHGQMHAARALRHELLVYRSHTPHAVGALTAGTRLAVALEFWHVHAPGEGVEHPAYPHRRVGLTLPLVGADGRCPR